MQKDFTVMFYLLLVQKFKKFIFRTLFLTLELPWKDISVFSQTYQKNYKKKT